MYAISFHHYSDVIRSAMSSKKTASGLFAELFVQAQIKEISQHCVTGPVTGGLPLKGPVTRKMFPFDDVTTISGRFVSGSGRLYLDVFSGSFHCTDCNYRYTYNKLCSATLTATYHHFHLLKYSHDDVIKRKPFPRHWPFVRGIHRSPVDSLQKGQWHGALVFSLNCA